MGRERPLTERLLTGETPLRWLGEAYRKAGPLRETPYREG